MTGNGRERVGGASSAEAGRRSLDAGAPAWDGLLVCTACGAGLKQGDKVLRCDPCRKEWPVAAGVPVFAMGSPREPEIPAKAVRRLNAVLVEKPWRDAVLDADDESVRTAADAILNVDRANWHWLTGLSTRARVLDVGAGLGAVSHALACRFHEVIALESVAEYVEFLRRRFDQEGIRNVRILQASASDIPLRPQSVDLVVLDGVLGWAGAGVSGDPKRLQAAMLKRAFELLAPGGWLYIGAENRLAWPYFFGAPDPHTRLPYVAILPRRLAGWFSRRQGHAEGYRTYLYSIRGYRKLLAGAGFTGHRFLLAMPSYRAPRLYLPVEQNIFSYYHENFEPLRSGLPAKIAHRVLSGLGLLKHLQHSFAILARKEA